MIPEFDEQGNLPPGVHFCDWSEFKERFGYTSKRSKMIEGMEKVMVHLKSAGCLTAYVNGSFVTSKLKPNDFDMCWDTDNVDMDYLRNNAPLIFSFHENAAQKSKYKGEIYRSDQFVNESATSIEFFQTDREENKKGIIGISLREWEP